MFSKRLKEEDARSSGILTAGPLVLPNAEVALFVLQPPCFPVLTLQKFQVLLSVQGHWSRRSLGACGPHHSPLAQKDSTPSS